MLILGVDPGSLVTGYGLIETEGSRMRRIASGTIVMKPSDSMALRLRSVYDGILAVIDEHHPDEFCIETAFYGKNIQSTLKLGQVRGVAILAAVHRQLAISEYSPREVKRAVTGSGAASKQQVEFMVRTLLNVPAAFRRSDEADGLALAICHTLQRAVPSTRVRDWKVFIERNPGRVRS
jgi:crossover junction endodeoxyribonuclease RuvC